VVFASSYSDALEFAHQTNLDLSTTTLLSDPEDHVPDDLYNAPTCPRVFVLDPNGIIRYTNNHADDAPRLVPGMAIALKALTAMRAAAPPTAPASAATGSSSP
jgi:alkyl hydroperoxide reductase subunit AhpC